eukprot:tig00000601_g2300.t1
MFVVPSLPALASPKQQTVLACPATPCSVRPHLGGCRNPRFFPTARGRRAWKASRHLVASTPVMAGASSGDASRPPHPLLASAPQALQPCGKLTEFDMICNLAVAHASGGNLEALVQDWQCLVGDEEKEICTELILQSNVICGIPRIINALGAIREADASYRPAAKEPPRGELAGTWEKGVDLNRAVYGSVYEKLRARMAELHPDLDTWMIEIAYGRVLSRPGPTRLQRELALCSSLAGMGVPPQLGSHLRGAVRLGATRRELRAVLDLARWSWGPAVAAEVDRVWGEMAPRLPPDPPEA